LIAPPKADFDLDNDVDGHDFLVWQRGLGLTEATREQGDANGDGTVDGADLAILQSQFGLTPNLAATSAVPEPATACLALAFLGGIAVRRRRRRRGPTRR
jgi:MYXO-CTERM domain-containing protein